MATRTETDMLGSIDVPADRYWGAQTERSRRNFRIGGERFPREFIRALGRIKHAAALANAALGALDAAKADAIAAAAAEVRDGALDDHFPLVIWQTGSGTQTNMNANEVIANRAIEQLGGVLGSKRPIHPNDDVNCSQSSNDVIPTAIHVSAAEEVAGALLPALSALERSLERRASEFDSIVKVGRTHLMDAVPLRMGDEWRTFARQLAAARARVEVAQDELLELPLGGTALGTGLNAAPGFDREAVRRLAEQCGLAFRTAPHKFQAIASHDAVAALHAALRGVAVALAKIAGDVRLLASGPRSGLGELVLPTNEPGSSIMPGKVNPTQCEAVLMVCAQVLGNDTAVAIAASGGQLQLNAYKPLLAFDLLCSIRWLAQASESFRELCIDGVEPEHAVIARLLERSLMLVTALVPELGYDRASAIARRAHTEGCTLREAALALGVPAEQFDRLAQPEGMLGPHSSSATRGTVK